MTYDELYGRYERLLADHLRLMLLMHALSTPLRDITEQLGRYDDGTEDRWQYSA